MEVLFLRSVAVSKECDKYFRKDNDDDSESAVMRVIEEGTSQPVEQRIKIKELEEDGSSLVPANKTEELEDDITVERHDGDTELQAVKDDRPNSTKSSGRESLKFENATYFPWAAPRFPPSVEHMDGPYSMPSRWTMLSRQGTVPFSNSAAVDVQKLCRTQERKDTKDYDTETARNCSNFMKSLAAKYSLPDSTVPSDINWPHMPRQMPPLMMARSQRQRELPGVPSEPLPERRSPHYPPKQNVDFSGERTETDSEENPPGKLYNLEHSHSWPGQQVASPDYSPSVKKRFSYSEESETSIKRMREALPVFDPQLYTRSIPLGYPHFPMFPCWPVPMNNPTSRFYPDTPTMPNCQERRLERLLTAAGDSEMSERVSYEKLREMTPSATFSRPNSRMADSRCSYTVDSSLTDDPPDSALCQLETDAMANWTVDDVYKFVSGIEICADYAQVFKDQSIDGATLPLLTEEHLITNVGMKLGPAIKLRTTVSKLTNKCLVCSHCLHCHDMSRISK